MFINRFDKNTKVKRFYTCAIITALSIARLTSVEMFDDDGGKPTVAGKSSVVNTRQGALLRSAALQMTLKYATSHQIKLQSNKKRTDCTKHLDLCFFLFFVVGIKKRGCVKRLYGFK